MCFKLPINSSYLLTLTFHAKVSCPFLMLHQITFGYSWSIVLNSFVKILQIQHWFQKLLTFDIIPGFLNGIRLSGRTRCPINFLPARIIPIWCLNLFKMSRGLNFSDRHHNRISNNDGNITSRISFSHTAQFLKISGRKSMRGISNMYLEHFCSCNKFGKGNINSFFKSTPNSRI
eukprot:NODE_323_length_9725_cov_0.840536.p8 type:complete len:175 gc:universal NODE_323_length_9725_cov_0.840536:765-1289(+)